MHEKNPFIPETQRNIRKLLFFNRESKSGQKCDLDVFFLDFSAMLGGEGGDAFITISMERKHMIQLNQEGKVMLKNKYLNYTQWYCFVFALYRITY